MKSDRPITADLLFATPEMALRYPGEIELLREGTDEGAGRGFDNADPSAGVSRTIAVTDSGVPVVAWFVDQVTALGWTIRGEGWLSRNENEHFSIRVDWDRGRSRVGAAILSEPNRRIQEEFEKSLFGEAADGKTVVTLSYTATSHPT